ncbi:hypothetical protein JCM1840_003400 [Sporobolomyces johnsonii]
MSSPLAVLPRETPAVVRSDDIDEKLSSSEKAQQDVDSADDSSVDIGIPEHAWRIKGPAIFFALFLTLGSNFASSSISPLKSTIKKQLGVDNTQYAVIDTADSLINTILPIISGVAIDYYGPLAGAIYAASVVALGAVLAGVAASTSNYGLMVFAQIVTGFGSTTIETVQSKIYSFYSVGMMGFVYGLDIGIGRVWNLMGRLTAVPIMEGTGNWAWTFWVSAIMCGFCWVLTIAFALYERTFPVQSRVPTGRQRAQRRVALIASSHSSEGKYLSFASRFKAERKYFLASTMAIPACFWILDISQLLQAGTVNAYSSNLADTISVTRDATKAAAGYTSAIGQVIPIVLTPCLGVFFDKFGRRMHWVTFTAGLWVLVFCLLAYTTVHPLVPTILGSLALATNVLPWIASIPLLVPNQANLGTAFGIYKALNSCGTVVMSVSAGSIQDRSTGRGVNQYDYVFAFLIVMKGLDVLYGLGYHWFDKFSLGGILHANERERVEAEQAKQANPELHPTPRLRQPIKEVTYVAAGVVAGMIVIAWVLYLTGAA